MQPSPHFTLRELTNSSTAETIGNLKAVALSAVCPGGGGRHVPRESPLIGSARSTKISAFLVLLIAVAALVGGCTSKAQTIQLGAAQFEAEALAAIEAIDTLRRAELEPAAESAEDASDFFARAVLNSSGEIGRETLDLLVDPNALDLGETDRAWSESLGKLKGQYRAFTSAFDSLDKGSLFAAAPVEDAIPVLNALTAQMAAFAQSIQNHPAEFVRRRAAVAIDLELIRDDPAMSDDVQRLHIAELERQLREVVAEERDVTQAAVAQALKTATVGNELGKLMADYDNVTIEDISDGLGEAFRIAGAIPGLDLAGLQSQSQSFIGEITADPALNRVFATALQEINDAR